MSSQIGGSSMHTGRPRQRVERQSANSLGSPRPKRASAIRLRAQVTSPCGSWPEAHCHQKDTSMGVFRSGHQNQIDDTPQLEQVCQTCARKGRAGSSPRSASAAQLSAMPSGRALPPGGRKR
jgi:hypothetical protein